MNKIFACFPVALVLIAGCSHLSAPVPLSVALSNIENDIRDSAPISLGDLDSLDGSTGAQGSDSSNRVAAAFRNAQCYFNTRNPTIPVAAAAYNIQLQGSFTQGGKFQVSGIPVPTAGLEYDITGAQTQQLTVPITFASLAGIPDLYLSLHMAYLKDVPEKNGRKAALVSEVISQRDKLQTLVREVSATYGGSSSCGETPHPPTVLYPIH